MSPPPSTQIHLIRKHLSNIDNLAASYTFRPPDHSGRLTTPYIMKKLLILALLPLASITSHAAMVQVQYQSTIDQGRSTYPDLGAGSEFFITILLDNGGDLEDNTWDSTHITSIAFQVGTGAGAFIGTFNTNDPGSSWGGSGGFSTNALGEVISSPLNWYGSNTGDIQWWINGDNEIFIDSSVDLWDISPDRNTVAGNWTATVVPEPSAALLGSLGALALLRRRRR